ncbi:MAG: insulinase family protein, partial [Clostridiales bacterium]|nr:insulinase family protein [Clostridiales bacterium]
VLPFLLSHTCRKYPDFIQMGERLEELYGASVRADVLRVGENQALTLRLLAVDDRFALNGESVSAECAQLLCDMLCDPVLENGLFRAEDVEREKRCLAELIESEVNEKRIHAKNRCEQVMCAGERYSAGRYGTIQSVQALTPETVTAAWKQALRSARIAVQALGTLDADAVKACFEDALSRFDREEPVDCRTEIVRTAGDVKRQTDRLPVSQAKLVLGFRAPAAEPDAEVMAVRLMCALFGGTPHSLLFLNVRERLSLCYYCAARYDRQKGILLVESGVEEENAKKAEEEILRQLDRIKADDFEQDTFDFTVLSMKNSFETMSDSQSTLAAWYAGQLLDAQMLSPQEASRRIEKVTRQQVVEAAKGTVLDTVYLLTGEEEAQ